VVVTWKICTPLVEPILVVVNNIDGFQANVSCTNTMHCVCLCVVQENFVSAQWNEHVSQTCEAGARSVSMTYGSRIGHYSDNLILPAAAVSDG
jgi:hypothetical protein